MWHKSRGNPALPGRALWKNWDTWGPWVPKAGLQRGPRGSQGHSSVLQWHKLGSCHYESVFPTWDNYSQSDFGTLGPYKNGHINAVVPVYSLGLGQPQVICVLCCMDLQRGHGLQCSCKQPFVKLSPATQTHKTPDFFRNGALWGTSSDSPNVVALGMDSGTCRDKLQENKPAPTLLYFIVVS